MKTSHSLSIVFVVLAWTIYPLSADQALGETALAMDVMKAAGIENWSNVSRMKFTFNVDDDGNRKVSAAHDWDIRKGKDTVKWDGRVATADVRYPKKNEGDAFEAYKRWVNDSLWLLAPLRLADKGVTVMDVGTKEINGENFPALEVSCNNVGLASIDKYVLYIDPITSLVRFWDYMPDEKTKKTASWGWYVESGGLNLSTRHEMGKTRITITEIEILTD